MYVSSALPYLKSIGGGLNLVHHHIIPEICPSGADEADAKLEIRQIADDPILPRFYLFHEGEVIG